MLTVGDTLPDFTLTGVKPGFMRHEENGEFARPNPKFDERDAVVLGGSTDNEHFKLGWRREHPGLHNLPIWNFADPAGRFAQALGLLDRAKGVALRATFLVDPFNVIQHVYVTNLNVGRAPADTLQVLDALQTDELCACNRAVGGETLQAA
jgi:alkyl hydroperoxide reductase subunit AhpC